MGPKETLEYVNSKVIKHQLTKKDKYLSSVGDNQFIKTLTLRVEGGLIRYTKVEVETAVRGVRLRLYLFLKVMHAGHGQ